MVWGENPPTRHQHFREKCFRCPFQYPNVPLEADAPPPQSFDASYAPAKGPILSLPSPKILSNRRRCEQSNADTS
jgi:hypothetical protein